jgi:hypothetical protein
MHRRRFLNLSLGSALLLSGLGGLAWLAPGTGRLPDAVAGRLRCLSSQQGRTLQAAALRILDGAEPAPSLDGAAAQILFIDRYLLSLAPPLRSDLRALLGLLEHAPLVRFGARFSRLDPAAQDQVLRGWEASRFDLLRQGLFALKSLCCLAHYQDERSFSAIGYSGPLVGRGASESEP